MKSALVLLVALTSSLLYSQKQAENWYFGYNAGLSFSTGDPVALTNGQLLSNEGTSTISDAEGNLLFYTNGVAVWNANHEVMENGTGLLGSNSSSQSSLILQKPGSETIYYIFTAGSIEDPFGVAYSEVDITAASGLGAVTSNKNIPLLPQSTEQLTATFHRNGRDIWVIAHGNGTGDNFFKTFLVTANGITTTPVTSSLGLDIGDDELDVVGCAKFSQDGSKLAVAHSTKGTFLYDFDNETGLVTNKLTLEQGYMIWYGVEFSPSGRFLYTSHIDDGLILQYDLQSDDVAASAVTVMDVNFINGGALQLAINGKIYYSHMGFSSLSVINQPDVLGPGCDVDEQGVSLQWRVVHIGLPSVTLWPADLEINTEDICQNDTAAFSFVANIEYDNLVWDFGDGSVSTEPAPQHDYEAAGSYTVTLTLFTSGIPRTTQQTITVNPAPQAEFAESYTICTGDILTVSAPEGFDSYTWSTGATSSSVSITAAGNYSVTIARDGCEAVYEFTVAANDCSFIPRGISPNDDGKNDSFNISGLDVQELSIFNRYGLEVYNAEDYTMQWQGQNSNGHDLPTGTYYYLIKSTSGSRSGWVYLNRDQN